MSLTPDSLIKNQHTFGKHKILLNEHCRYEPTNYAKTLLKSPIPHYFGGPILYLSFVESSIYAHPISGTGKQMGDIRVSKGYLDDLITPFWTKESNVASLQRNGKITSFSSFSEELSSFEAGLQVLLGTPFFGGVVFLSSDFRLFVYKLELSEYPKLPKLERPLFLLVADFKNPMVFIVYSDFSCFLVKSNSVTQKAQLEIQAKQIFLSLNGESFVAVSEKEVAFRTSKSPKSIVFSLPDSILLFEKNNYQMTIWAAFVTSDVVLLAYNEGAFILTENGFTEFDFFKEVHFLYSDFDGAHLFARQKDVHNSSAFTLTPVPGPLFSIFDSKEKKFRLQQILNAYYDYNHEKSTLLEYFDDNKKVLPKFISDFTQAIPHITDQKTIVEWCKVICFVKQQPFAFDHSLVETTFKNLQLFLSLWNPKIGFVITFSLYEKMSKKKIVRILTNTFNFDMANIFAETYEIDKSQIAMLWALQQIRDSSFRDSKLDRFLSDLGSYELTDFGRIANFAKKNGRNFSDKIAKKIKNPMDRILYFISSKIGTPSGFIPNDMASDPAFECIHELRDGHVIYSFLAYFLLKGKNKLQKVMDMLNDEMLGSHYTYHYRFIKYDYVFQDIKSPLLLHAYLTIWHSQPPQEYGFFRDGLIQCSKLLDKYPQWKIIVEKQIELIEPLKKRNIHTPRELLEIEIRTGKNAENLAKSLGVSNRALSIMTFIVHFSDGNFDKLTKLLKGNHQPSIFEYFSHRLIEAGLYDLAETPLSKIAKSNPTYVKDQMKLFPDGFNFKDKTLKKLK